MKIGFRSIFLPSLVLIGSTSFSLGAQATSPELSVAWGAMQFDASGTGTVPMMAVRGDVPLLGSWLLGEANLSFASLDEQFSEVGTRVGVAEGQLQLQLPLYRVRPYVGLGGGWFHYFTNADGRPNTAPTLSGAAGLRLKVAHQFGAMAELRVRGWDHHTDSFYGSAAEWTGGLSYSF